jgi:hypothetical protein
LLTERRQKEERGDKSDRHYKRKRRNKSLEPADVKAFKVDTAPGTSLSVEH